MDAQIGSGGPGKDILDRIAVSNFMQGVSNFIEPCAVAFSLFLVVWYTIVIVCLTTDVFKLELRRRIIEEQTQREQARQSNDNTEPTSSTPSENTGRGSLPSRILRPSILDKLTLKDPRVISYLACYTMAVVFGIGNLYAIFERDLDLMWTSVVFITLSIVITSITSCSIALQERNVFSIIVSINCMWSKLCGCLLLYILYKQLRDEQLGDRN